jgi:hypothetical protein
MLITYLYLILLFCSLSSAALPTVSVNQVDLFWSRITNGGGNDCVNNSIPCSVGRNKTRVALQSASSLGFKVIRFAASGFWPVDHKLWFDVSTRSKFFEALDTVFEDAKMFNVQLIPSLMWNQFSFVDICRNNSMSKLMKSTTSCSHQNAKIFTQMVVQRYSIKYSNQIKAWELGNELNNLVDLDLAKQQPSIAPALGTPKFRTSADNFTTVDMMRFQSNMNSWIRAFDTQTPISSGLTIARPSAWHLRNSYFLKNRNWSKDTQKEYIQTIIDQNECCNFISMHLYPGIDNIRWNMSTSQVLKYTIETIKNKFGEQKQIYLGEFGVSLPDRRNPSSLNYNFTSEILNVVKEEVLLATYWVWQFQGQLTTMSIEANGLDEHTINELRSANVGNMNKT